MFMWKLRDEQGSGYCTGLTIHAIPHPWLHNIVLAVQMLQQRTVASNLGLGLSSEVFLSYW